MSITTIIFDYGCVLSLAPTAQDYESLRQAIGPEVSAFQEIYWRYREAYDLDALDNHSYWQKFGSRRASLLCRPDGEMDGPRLSDLG